MQVLLKPMGWKNSWEEDTRSFKTMQQASKACSDGQEQYTILLYLSFHLRLSFLLIMAKNKVKD